MKKNQKLRILFIGNSHTYSNDMPEIEMYAKEGAHASERGSDFAAKYIWDVIETDLHRSGRKD